MRCACDLCGVYKRLDGRRVVLSAYAEMTTAWLHQLIDSDVEGDDDGGAQLPAALDTGVHLLAVDYMSLMR